MQNFFSQILPNFFSQAIIAEILAIIIVAFIAAFIVDFFLSQITKLTKKTKNFWDDSLIKAARSPIILLVWIVAIKFCSEIILQKFDQEKVFLINPIFKILIVLSFAWFLLRLINFVISNIIISEKFINDEFSKTTIDAISKLLKLIVVILTILTILQFSGFNISALLAAGGAGGLVVGFAAKDLFANVFGGLTIYLDRPFNVGDWIRCTSVSGVEGTVEHIGWRQTRIRAFNKNPIYVPNAIFTNAVVENPSRMTHRRIKESIGIRYQDIAKMPLITSEVREMLLAHHAIDNDQTVIVNFDIFNASSIDFMIDAFTKTTNRLEFCQLKEEILLKIAAIIAKHQAEIAFPTQTIYLNREGN